MEKKQFVFTGLDWMNPDTTQQLKNGLKIASKFGIDWQIIHDNTGVRLEISGFDTIIENKLCDDDPVIFTVKHTIFEKDEEQVLYSEDHLIIIMIDCEMGLTIKELSYNGTIKEMY